MVTKPTIWPQGRFGVPQITPYTYRDGQTLLELITSLRDHVVDQLHPNLQKAIDKLVADVESEYDKAHDRYVEGVQEFQRIHDAFMSDVNATLVALNDDAVTDLVNDDTSLLSTTLKSIFVLQDELDEQVTNQLTDEFSSTHHTVSSMIRDRIPPAPPLDHLNAMWRTRNTHNTFIPHTEFGITGDGDQTENIKHAIATMPEGHTLTIPPTMHVRLSETITITRPINIMGGIFECHDNVTFQIESHNVGLSDMTIYCSPASNGLRVDRAILVEGSQSQYWSNIHIDNVTVPTSRHTPIRFNYVEHSTITNCHVEQFLYCGIMVMSGRHIDIENNVCQADPADQYQNHLGYGIAVSDSANVEEHRSRHVQVLRNKIYDIRSWEGLDTHGGWHIVFDNNMVFRCLNGITITVGNSTRSLAPERCRVTNNFIDGGNIKDSRGITFAGSWPANKDHPLAIDAIISYNTLVNLDSRAITYPGVGQSTAAFDFDRLVVQGNTGDTGSWSTDGENYNSGWTDIERFGSFGRGFSRGVGPIRGQLRITPNGRVFSISGYVTMSTNRGSTVFQLRNNDNTPRLSSAVGIVRAEGGGLATLNANSDGSISISGATGSMSGRLIIAASWVV